MSATQKTRLAEQVIRVLREHETELREAGVRHLWLFGSVARGDAEADSDIDLAAEFDPAARMDLFRLAALERRMSELLGRRVADIIENAQRIETYTAGMDGQLFKEDNRTRDAVERCLERICKAAHRLGTRADELMPRTAMG
jgi:predicted nucleotidyltransferase